MLQISTIRENKDLVIERLAAKRFDAKASVERILNLDEDKRKIQGEYDSLLQYN